MTETISCFIQLVLMMTCPTFEKATSRATWERVRSQSTVEGTECVLKAGCSKSMPCQFQLGSDYIYTINSSWCCAETRWFKGRIVFICFCGFYTVKHTHKKKSVVTLYGSNRWDQSHDTLKQLHLLVARGWLNFHRPSGTPCSPKNRNKKLKKKQCGENVHRTYSDQLASFEPAFPTTVPQHDQSLVHPCITFPWLLFPTCSS